MSPGQLLAAAVLFAVVSGALVVARSRRVRWWREVASRLELKLDGGILRPLLLRGVVDDFTVKISVRDRKVFVEIGGRLPRGLELGAENLLTLKLAPDVRTGDEEFDREARVTGPPDLALAVLDAEARELVLREIVSGRARYSPEGRILAEWPDSRAAEAIGCLPDLLDLGRALRLNRAAVGRLLEKNAAHDPHPDVRLRNLRALQEHHPRHPACRRACAAGLEAEGAELRLWSASFLGGGSEERIEKGSGPDSELAERAIGVLADLAMDRSVPEDVNVRALREVARSAGKQRAIPVLEEALGSRRTRVQRAAVEGLARFRHRRAAGRLAGMAGGVEAATARSIAEALGAIGGPEAESGLIELLDHDDGEVRRAAIRSLGLVGSVAAVEPLLEVAGNLGLSREARLAQSAKFRIQTRLEGAESGQVSIAEPAELEGALSEAGEGPGKGAVSLERNGARPEGRE